jgi:hypothetical protein
MVASEWGPVRLFANRAGRLVEATKEAGLDRRLGWWNSITGADFDGDGDIDYAALNAGLNTKYGHASVEKPAILYLGDMDRNGTPDLVEAKASPEGELPVRGRSCSSTAMPFIKEKFKTYREFASANLAGIYTEPCLEEATRVMATEFESGLLINESTKGQPRFAWRSLPPAAQLSPGYGTVAADLSGDGRPSLAIAQNFHSREPETGLWRGSLGCLLRPSNKDGDLVAERHDSSGFVVPGDGKGLALADLDADGWPDLVATQNNDRLLAFGNQHPGKPPPLVVRLAGPPGNPSALGARVSLMAGDRPVATAEVYGGSGYLSQSSAAITFTQPENAQALRISVRWPSGKVTESPIKKDQQSIKIPGPANQPPTR